VDLIFFEDRTIKGFCSKSQTPYMVIMKFKLEFARHVRK